MSNFLAIATVTATLKNLLQNAIGSDVAEANVKTERPEDLENASREPVVNIYLYQVTPHAAYRNADLPTRDAQGRVVTRPQAALELHYLLTFLGEDKDLVPQRLLGSVVRELHAHSILTRDEIERARNGVSYLNNSNLHEQVELIKFSPIVLNLEELSKLWSVFFQTAYRLSVAYQVSVVLIEGKETPRATLPVEERNVHGYALEQPVIEKVLSQKGNADPRENQPLQLDDVVILVGKRLKGEETYVRFDDEDVLAELPIVLSDTQIKFTLAPPLVPNRFLQVGKHCLQVVHRIKFTEDGEPHKIFTSNPIFITLQPTLESVSVE